MVLRFLPWLKRNVMSRRQLSFGWKKTARWPRTNDVTWKEEDTESRVEKQSREMATPWSVSKGGDWGLDSLYYTTEGYFSIYLWYFWYYKWIFLSSVADMSANMYRVGGKYNFIRSVWSWFDKTEACMPCLAGQAERRHDRLWIKESSTLATFWSWPNLCYTSSVFVILISYQDLNSKNVHIPNFFFIIYCK